MEQSRLHIRLDFAPLDIAVSLSVLSTGSAVTQTYNASTGEYEPNRQLTPTVIYPSITLDAQDGSLTTAYGNQQLSTDYIQWYVDNAKVESVWQEGSDYEIVTSGEYKGGIRIYKNFLPDEGVSLRFEGKLTDTRTDEVYTIVSDSIMMATVEMTEDITYNLCLVDDTSIQYDPLKDRLFAYEYKVSHGYEDETTTGRENATDEHSYLHTIPLQLFAGDGLCEEEYTIKVYDILGINGSSFDLSEITITDDDDNEFDEISADKLVIDLRMVDRKEYLIRAFIGDTSVSEIQLSVSRVETQYFVKSLNATSRHAGDTTRKDKCVVIANAQRLEYPESVIRLLWKTDSKYLTDVEHGEGSSVEYSIASTGAGNTKEDGWIEEYIESEHKEAHVVATDEDGTIWCDEDGNTLIFN